MRNLVMVAILFLLAVPAVAQADTLVYEDINLHYGATPVIWHRLRSNDWQFEVNPQGDLRGGVRGELAHGLQGRLLGTLKGGDLTEIRPELMAYGDNWWSFASVGVNTKNGAVSLYDETVADFAHDRNWKLGLALVHMGGLGGDPSSINLGPHAVWQMSPTASLDLHYGPGFTSGTSGEGWIIARFKVK